jgi:hypothetical protein
MNAFSEKAVPAAPDQNLSWENDWLRREDRILK